MKYLNHKTIRKAIDKRMEEMKLTGSEFRVLQYLAMGYKDHEIAEIMIKSPRTINSQRQSMIKKFKAKNTTHAVSLAYKRGKLQIS